jgi:hypothetical protein
MKIASPFVNRIQNYYSYFLPAQDHPTFCAALSFTTPAARVAHNPPASSFYFLFASYSALPCVPIHEHICSSIPLHRTQFSFVFGAPFDSDFASL